MITTGTPVAFSILIISIEDRYNRRPIPLCHRWLSFGCLSKMQCTVQTFNKPADVEPINEEQELNVMSISTSSKETLSPDGEHLREMRKIAEIDKEDYKKKLIKESTAVISIVKRVLFLLSVFLSLVGDHWFLPNERK